MSTCKAIYISNTYPIACITGRDVWPGRCWDCRDRKTSLCLASLFCTHLFAQGSGKTLAYGLPILHYLLSQPCHSKKTKRRLRALILAPTRELALQVASHLNMCLYAAETVVKAEAEEEANAVMPEEKKGKEKGKENKPKGVPLISIAAIVGGMSAQKQRRILDRGVEVLVATPGRLWDILEDVRTYLVHFCC